MNEQDYALLRTVRLAKHEKDAQKTGCRASDGSLKNGWETEAQAMSYMHEHQRRISEQGKSKKLSHYKCPHCGLFHITSRIKKPKRHIRRNRKKRR